MAITAYTVHKANCDVEAWFDCLLEITANLQQCGNHRYVRVLPDTPTMAPARPNDISWLGNVVLEAVLVP